MTTVDIFIKTYHKDFIWLEYLLKSIKKFASGFRRVIIVSDDDGNMLPDHFKDIVDFTVIYVKVKSFNHREMHYPGIGYVWQQCVKLSWNQYTDADEVVIMDCDEMLSCPTTPNSFKTNGKYNWYYSKWEDVGQAICHKSSTDVFLKYNTPWESMRTPVFYFTLSASLELDKYLNKHYGTGNIYDIINILNLTRLSEFNIYGNFIRMIEHSDYNYLDNPTGAFNNTIILSWSWGGLSEKDKQKRLDILNS